MGESAVAETRETVWFPFRGGRFVALSSSPVSAHRFRHEVLRVGRWVHPDTDQVLEFSRADLAEIAECTNEWIELGHKVWFPDGHNAEAVKNLGFCSNFRVEGDVLVADFDVPDAATASKIGKTIVDVSPGIQWGATASDETQFPVVIYHVAATPCPVLPGQGNFQKLAKELLSMGANATLGAEDRKDSPSKFEPAAGAKDQGPKPKQDGPDADDDNTSDSLAVEGEGDAGEGEAGAEGEGMNEGGDPGALVTEIKGALGLGPDASNETVLKAIQQMCAAGNDDGGVPVVNGVMSKKLAREVELARGEVKLARGETASLRVELSTERKARANDKVEAAKRASMKTGILLPPERAKRALDLLSRDDAESKADGQAILDDHAARISDRESLLSKVAAEGFRVEPDEAADEGTKKRKRDTALGKKALLEASGYSVELSKDGTDVKFEKKRKR